MACKVRKLSEERSKLYHSPYRWEHISKSFILITSYEIQNEFFCEVLHKKNKTYAQIWHLICHES